MKNDHAIAAVLTLITLAGPGCATLVGQADPCNRSVPAEPPDSLLSVDSHYYENSNLIRDSNIMSGTFPRNLIDVHFGVQSTPDERRDAISSVCGEVVAGRTRFGLRYFILEVPARSDRELFDLIDELRDNPHVRLAGPNMSAMSMDIE